jgi:hypothetical protein
MKAAHSNDNEKESVHRAPRGALDPSTERLGIIVSVGLITLMVATVTVASMMMLSLFLSE